MLWWNALAAALVAALFLLLRDATGRPGLAALITAGAALTPPFLFYFFQFYPEMLGALVFAVALRWLLFRAWWRAPEAWALGALLATLPWLHQKFLPAWVVLAAWAVLKLVGELAPLRVVLGVLVPQAVSLFLFALYNFAITGSVRPDALFLAWGPGGVSGARVGQGLLGLLLDARYGIVPYVPFLLLAGGGLLMEGSLAARGCRRWRSTTLTVAAADNWSGAVCNLGRYFMPAAPFAVALVGVVLARAGHARGPARGRPHARGLDGGDRMAPVARPARRQRLRAAPGAERVRRRQRLRAEPVPARLGRRRPRPLGAGAGMGRAGGAARVVERAGGGGARGGIAAAHPGHGDGGAAGARLRARALARRAAGARVSGRGGRAARRHRVPVRDGLDHRRALARAADRRSACGATGDGAVRIPGVPPFVVARGCPAPRPTCRWLRVAHLTGRRGVEEWLYRQRIAVDGEVAIDVVR